MPKTYATTKGSSGGGGTPGGSDTQVQFNDSSAFGGDAGFTYNKTTDTITIAGDINFPSDASSLTRTIKTLDQSGANLSASKLLVSAGNGNGSGTGGRVSVGSGSGDTTGGGGELFLYAGDGGSSSGSGGQVTITTGSPHGGNNDGGFLEITTGSGKGSGQGGTIDFTLGEGLSTGAGGSFNVNAGTGRGGSPGGSLNLFAGRGSNSNSSGGDIWLGGGSKNGSGIAGHIKIQDPSSGRTVVLETSALATTDKTYTFPNVTGTFNVIPATGRATAQVAANASVATYTPAADGSFLISANVLVTTATVHSFTVTCAYTDEGNTARTLTLTFSNVGGTLLTAIANAGGAVPYEGIPLHIRVKGGTAITIATVGTFTTVTYNVEGVIQQIA